MKPWQKNNLGNAVLMLLLLLALWFCSEMLPRIVYSDFYERNELIPEE